jgi:hypothetical protein
VSFAAITLCAASRRVFIAVYFVIVSVRKLLDTPSYISQMRSLQFLIRMHIDVEVKLFRLEIYGYKSNQGNRNQNA